MFKLFSKRWQQFLVWRKFRRVVFASLGPDCAFKWLSSTFSSAEKISLGSDVHVGPGAIFDGAGRISIGDGTVFAPRVKIYSRSHNFDKKLRAVPFDNIMLTSPVTIGRYVWVGADAIILPGVTIGDGAVIGAGAVVTKAVPSCAVAAGNPAAVVRYRDKAAFAILVNEPGSFVYKRFGHKKVLVDKRAHAGDPPGGKKGAA
jgi:acetyltransferase-like isoleucine patch superfamily enzyme